MTRSDILFPTSLIKVLELAYITRCIFTK